MKKMIVKTNSYHETIDLGIRIGKAIGDRHIVILLDGDLAAGKTTLTKGIAEGLGIKSTITSPTFTILKEYENNSKKLYHLDLYRLTEVGMDFDLEEYVDDLDSVVVIEWPFQVIELLPKEFIKISITGNNDYREFEITYQGNYKEVIDKI
ncbi:tRNA (adenosine(37)-N6)-threonylcarbamoyltransferase complex ATPase subunit type 1 TsaE [Haploplasma axanthum]|uniref:tRNA (adenosine(37)-N6)-threonylcarbamoyltransferase complex ATPase subunit type 1 TsaE n=1 Tax=Haploplasma axanthum TaxID=29552 RepID=UPI00138B04DA|nr:tRNA (adenosine(37)-N6)-threonylcarbamoyltransferase complex ATPase subunit type 1 TsaE [Haploplasma axanthum]